MLCNFNSLIKFYRGNIQGDNFLPLLFALYINDFSHYVGRSYKGLFVSKSCYHHLKARMHH